MGEAGSMMTAATQMAVKVLGEAGETMINIRGIFFFFFFFISLFLTTTTYILINTALCSLIWPQIRCNEVTFSKPIDWLSDTMPARV